MWYYIRPEKKEKVREKYSKKEGERITNRKIPDCLDFANNYRSKKYRIEGLRIIEVHIFLQHFCMTFLIFYIHNSCAWFKKQYNLLIFICQHIS